jgi:hypothetical protein
MSGLVEENPLAPLILPRIYPWEVDGLAQVQATATAGYLAIASYTFDTASRGFCTGYGYDVLDPTYDFSGSLVFQLARNGQVVGSMTNWSAQHGTPQEPQDTLLYCQPGDQVVLSVKRAVTSAMPHTVVGLLKGRTWPQIYCLPFLADQAKAMGQSGTMQAAR